MNQGRLWTVVNPTVGLPLFIGGVATISLLLHFAILSNAQWFPDFISGAGSMAQVDGAKATNSK